TASRNQSGHAYSPLGASLTSFSRAGTFLYQGSFTYMTSDQKFNPIRKGLLEFLILQIISADKVYVADMMKRLQETDFATQEGTLYPLLSHVRREECVDQEGQGSESGPPGEDYKGA